MTGNSCCRPPKFAYSRWGGSSLSSTSVDLEGEVVVSLFMDGSRIRMSPKDHSRMDYMLDKPDSSARPKERVGFFEEQEYSLSPNGVRSVPNYIDRSSSSVMQVGGRSGSESFSQTENGIRLMLAPRSANAKHSSSGNSQGIRNLPGSPSFWVTCQDDRDHMFIHRVLRLEQGSLEVRATSVSFSLFPNFIEFVDLVISIEYGSFFSCSKRYGKVKTEGLVFGTGATTGATMGSKTRVVIGSGLTGGLEGAVLCEQRRVQLGSFVTSVIGLYEDSRNGGLDMQHRFG
ncbi:hypothetical protein Tco_0268860 [Tanacetum coccineum]